jgi:adenylate cyclase class 2
MLEIEIKAKIDNPDIMRERIKSLGGHYAETRNETDYYYNHPSRDFRETGEAFRIRVDDNGACVTYKGPRLGGKTKTRVENETDVGDFHVMRDIIESLGFKESGVVCKNREYYKYENATLTIDSVKGVGDFIEIEMVGEDRSAIEPLVLDIAGKIGVKDFEKRSYLAMVLGEIDE